MSATIIPAFRQINALHNITKFCKTYNCYTVLSAQNGYCTWITKTNPIESDANKTKWFNSEKTTTFVADLINEFNKELSEGGVVPVFKKALIYGDKIAIKDVHGEHSYAELYGASKRLSTKISNICGSGAQSRVAILTENDSFYVVSQWASWISGQIVVPLSDKYPREMLEYYVRDCQAELLITTPKHEGLMKGLSMRNEIKLLVVEPSILSDCPNKGQLDKESENVLSFNAMPIIEGCLFGNFYARANAMILYTSGSTGQPKGVLISHRSLQAQVSSLTQAWHWHPRDTILHTLPLNHTHGIVNALLCPLDSGAKVVVLPKFNAAEVWSHLTTINSETNSSTNIFMGVPTMYMKLIEEYDANKTEDSKRAEFIKSVCQSNVRLMVSGSAPLPETIFQRWFDITGHRLLERYGMTEIGMALSNPYIEDDEQRRVIGSVGAPLPGVQVRLVQETQADSFKTLVQITGKANKGFWKGKPVNVLNMFMRKDNESATELFAKPDKKSAVDQVSGNVNNLFENTINGTMATEIPIDTNDLEDIIPTEVVQGELLIRGPAVFSGYYNRAEQTKKEFVEKDWFRTGDTASFENGIFKISGRTSVDIIKTGGYKVSALQIENVLLENPKISDCVVVGLPDDTWGQKITALVVFKIGQDITLDDVKPWCTSKLPEYAVPTKIVAVEEIPRNFMGKVNKKDIIQSLLSKKV